MKTVWTQLALEDLDHLWKYIADNNPTAADNMLEQIGKSVQNLVLYPKLGRLGRVKGTRELVIINSPYVTAYRIKKDQIEILSIIHTARRWPESLE